MSNRVTVLVQVQPRRLPKMKRRVAQLVEAARLTQIPIQTFTPISTSSKGQTIERFTKQNRNIGSNPISPAAQMKRGVVQRQHTISQSERERQVNVSG
jgi:hypothetical protein